VEFETREATSAQLQIFLSFFVLSSAKCVIPNFFFFFTYVVFAQIMHVCIVYMKVTRPRVHYRVIVHFGYPFAVSGMSSTQKF
jgi:hypothetical protein